MERYICDYHGEVQANHIRLSRDEVSHTCPICVRQVKVIEDGSE